ncbi:unnamed protein product [Rotaria magnacalcarata]
MLFISIVLFLISSYPAFTYTAVVADNDLYGIKIAMNDRLLVSAANLFAGWFISLLPNNENNNCMISFNSSTCGVVYNVIVPFTNDISFVYNCIDLSGNNVIGFFIGHDNCTFVLQDESIVSNYSTQYNYVIDINEQGTGVYGFADDFILYYELQPTIQLFVWSNTLGISPRAVDVGSNYQYAVLVGYCQSTPSIAVECGFFIQLNTSQSCPTIINEFAIANVLQFPWTDPRSNQFISQSRVYTSPLVLSVSVAWSTGYVLIGVQSLNTVFLYSLNDTSNPIGTRDNGIELMGYGKSVGWLDDHGHKAVILANSYEYSTFQWISSSIHVYDIQSNGFSNGVLPILIYPNSQQVLHPLITASFLRLAFSSNGSFGIFDQLGNAVGIIAAPAGSYPNTNTTVFTSIAVPCILGTYRDYPGVELCCPCSGSSNCSLCTSENSYCPYGAVGDIKYSEFESVSQNQAYPESPDSTVFDDILMQNMFNLNFKSVHCTLVSPLTWVFFVIFIAFIVVIGMTLSEKLFPSHHIIRNQAKQLFRRVDLVGEGELWIGGLVSAAIIVLVVSACTFSNAYLSQYPIELVTKNSSFACDITLRNAKFSTSMQNTRNSRRPQDEMQLIFDLLNSQPFTLNIDLVQTAFNCQDSFYVQRVTAYTTIQLPIAWCQTTYNNTTLSLSILLPVHTISVQLILPGVKTIGAIRVGLSGPSAEEEDGRYTLMELMFISMFIPSSLDQVLSQSTVFPIQLTQIVNETAPLNMNGLSTFSAIWTYSFNVETGELFQKESQYTFFYRSQTNISIIIGQNTFYIKNLQQPIVQQTELIFHNLLFAIVVLEVFGLLFLIIKLLFAPILGATFIRLYFYLSKKIRVTPTDDLTAVIAKDKDTSDIHKQSCIKTASHHTCPMDITAEPASDE